MLEVVGSSIWICEQWSEEVCQFARKERGWTSHMGISSEILRKITDPEVVVTFKGNLFLNIGIQNLWALGCATSAPTACSNAAGRIGVGDSATAAAATQTGLQAGSNKTYKAMNSTYPSISGQTMSFQSDFLTADANYVWNEWTVDNGNPAQSLNRLVQSLGTKTTGTWTLTAQLTIA